MSSKDLKVYAMGKYPNSIELDSLAHEKAKGHNFGKETWDLGKWVIEETKPVPTPFYVVIDTLILVKTEL